MQRSSFLIRLFWVFMLVFAVGRVAFMLYNADLWPSPADPAVTGLDGATWLKDMILAWFHGAAQQDIIVAAVLCALPALLELCGVRRLRRWLVAYYVVAALVVGIIITADAVLYEFWQFKLNAVVLAYAAYPEGTTNSVAPSFIVTRLGAGLALVAATAAGCIWATPSRSEWAAPLRRRLQTAGVTLAAFVLCVLCVAQSGGAYFSERIFLNHAAVNPVCGFVGSFSIHQPSDRYDYFDDAERASLVEGLYVGNAAAPTPADTSGTRALLNTSRPDVLIVFVESFGSEFVTSLGGARGTTPDGRTEDVDQQLERLIPEGIWWTNYYSNSFRTDRGTVSAFCGWPAYTDVGLMTERRYHAALPSIAKSMKRVGYDTSYLYAGAMTNMGKADFLDAVGFDHLLDDSYFSAAELDGPWGAGDMTSARKTAQALMQHSERPRLFCYQTLSSHEPWDVPYQRLTDRVQNAFAYTDAALGQLIDTLRTSPVWDNLLVVVIPDHGHLYQVPAAAGGTGSTAGAGGAAGASAGGALHHQAFDDPGFFHSPMLWLGGAVKSAATIDVLMNQSDLCATLLAQLGIDGSDYKWSRNVLSRDYRYPFVYCAYPAGLLFRDASGTTLYDVSADCITMQHDAGSAPQYGPRAASSEAGALRLRRAKALLQTSYDGL